MIMAILLASSLAGPPEPKAQVLRTPSRVELEQRAQSWKRFAYLSGAADLLSTEIAAATMGHRGREGNPFLAGNPWKRRVLMVSSVVVTAELGAKFSKSNSRALRGLGWAWTRGIGFFRLGVAGWNLGVAFVW